MRGSWTVGAALLIGVAICGFEIHQQRRASAIDRATSTAPFTPRTELVETVASLSIDLPESVAQLGADRCGVFAWIDHRSFQRVAPIESGPSPLRRPSDRTEVVHVRRARLRPGSAPTRSRARREPGRTLPLRDPRHRDAIVDPDGNPIVGALYAAKGRYFSQTGASDASGVVRARHVFEPEELVLAAPGFAARRVYFDPDSIPSELELQLEVELTIRPDFPLTEDVTLSIHYEDDDIEPLPAGWIPTRDGDRWRIHGLGRIRIASPGFNAASGRARRRSISGTASGNVSRSSPAERQEEIDRIARVSRTSREPLERPSAFVTRGRTWSASFRG